MTVFSSPFLFLRHPNGGVEDLDRQKAAGFQGVFCNIGDHPPEAWEYIIRPRAQALGMFCGPWLHTRAADGSFSRAKLEQLVEIADDWKSPLIVNSEKEIDNSGNAITRIIRDAIGTRDAAVSMEAWLFNPPSVDWTPLQDVPFLLQIFPAESPAAADPAGCKQHAHDVGIRCVYFTYGSYGGQTPVLFDLTAPYSIYTGDDCGGDYNAWRPRADGFQACTDTNPDTEDDGMEKIGSQHGLDAMLKWLQAQPSVPQRGPSYDPARLDTWPWPDKVHRALTILVDDHDSNAGGGS